MLDIKYKFDNKTFFPIINTNKEKINDRIVKTLENSDELLGFDFDKYNSDKWIFDVICKVHKEIYRDYSFYSGVEVLNYSYDVKNVDKKIYDSFYSNRNYNIFIHIYDSPNKIKMVIRKIFKDFGSIEDILKLDFNEMIEKLSNLIIKLHQGNIFKFGNIEVIFIITSHIFKMIGESYKNPVHMDIFNYMCMKSLLEHKNIDSYEYLIIKQQIALSLKQLLFCFRSESTYVI